MKNTIANYDLSLISQSNSKHIFGIIINTQSNAHIIKVLKDNDYWAALDTNSGPDFPIFSIKPKDNIAKEKTKNKFEFDYLIPIWKEPKENE